MPGGWEKINREKQNSIRLKASWVYGEKKEKDKTSGNAFELQHEESKWRGAPVSPTNPALGVTHFSRNPHAWMTNSCGAARSSRLLTQHTGSYVRARCSRWRLRFHVQAALLEQRSSVASLEPCSQIFFSILLQKVWHRRKHQGAWVWVVQGCTRPFTSRCTVLGKKFIFEDAVSPHCKGEAYTRVPGTPSQTFTKKKKKKYICSVALCTAVPFPLQLAAFTVAPTFLSGPVISDLLSAFWGCLHQTS